MSTQSSLKDDGLSFRFLLIVLASMAIGWLLLLPKIYLQSSIYYKSRDIAQLQREYDTLTEENRVLQREVEQMHFKNSVLDSMFDMEDE